MVEQAPLLLFCKFCGYVTCSFFIWSLEVFCCFLIWNLVGVLIWIMCNFYINCWKVITELLCICNTSRCGLWLHMRGFESVFLGNSSGSLSPHVCTTPVLAWSILLFELSFNVDLWCWTLFFFLYFSFYYSSHPLESFLGFCLCSLLGAMFFFPIALILLS